MLAEKHYFDCVAKSPVSADLKVAELGLYMFINPIYTSDNGAFSYTFIPYPLQTNDYFARVYSETDFATVKDGDLYSEDSTTISVGVGSSVTLPFTNLDSEEWNILDSVTEIAYWIRDNTDGWTRNQVKVQYPGTKDNSFYSVNDDEINIHEDHGWQDRTMYHEYGHAVMNTLYSDFPETDYIRHNYNTEHTQEFALVEGWAEIFGHAVGGGSEGNWIDSDPNPSKILDEDIEYARNRAGVGQPAFNYKDWWGIESDDDDDEILERDKVEGNICGILYDIYDSPETSDWFYPIDSDWTANNAVRDPYDDDGFSLGFDEIFDVFENGQPHTIHEFWDDWFDSTIGTTAANRINDENTYYMKKIFYNHGVEVSDYSQAPPDIWNFRITSTPVNGYYSQNDILTFSLSINDQDSEDIDFLQIDITADIPTLVAPTLDLGSFSISDLTYNGFNYDGSISLTGLSDNDYLMSASVTDFMDITSLSPVDELPFSINSNPPNAPTLSEISCGDDWTTYAYPHWVWSYDASNPEPVDLDHFEITLSGVYNEEPLGSFNWMHTAPLSSGVYDCKVRAVDTAGLKSAWSNEVTVKIDRNRPQMSNLISPSDSEVVDTSTPTLQWSCIDDHSSIQYSEIWLEQSATFSNPIIAYPSTLSFTTSLDEGIWFWKVRGVDEAGNIGDWSLIQNFEVDSQAAFSVDINDGSSYTRLPSVSLDISQLDYQYVPEQMRFKVNSGQPSLKTSILPSYINSPHDVPNNYDQTWVIHDPEASYIRVTFLDMSLQPGDFLYIYDESNYPNTPIQTYSDIEFGKSFNGQWFDSNSINGDKLFIRLVTNANNPSWGFRISQYKYYSSWGPWSLYSSTYNLNLNQIGLNSVHCQVRENINTINGDMVLSPIEVEWDIYDNIFYDGISPTATYSIVESSSNIFVSGNSIYYDSSQSSSFSIQIAASDEASGSQLNYATGSSVFGDSPTDFDEKTGLYQFELTYSIEASSTYEGPISISVYDHAGNANTHSFILHLSTTGPSVTLSNPVDAKYINTKQPTFTWITESFSCPTDEYNIQIGTDSLFSNVVIDDNLQIGTFSCPIQLDEAVTYYWRVRALDHLGHWGVFSNANSFVIDVTVPTSIISSPASASSHNTLALDIIGTAEDTNLEKYELYYAESIVSHDWILLSQGSTGISNALIHILDTTYLINNDYKLRLTVYDLAANVGSTEITFNLNSDARISDLSIAGTTADRVHFSFFLNSLQTVSAYVFDPASGHNIRDLYSGSLISAGWHTPGMSWDWKDSSGNQVASGTYNIIMTSLESATIQSISYTIYPAPVITVIAGSGSVTPTIQWTNPFGVSGVEYHLNVYPFKTYQQSIQVTLPRPGSNRITIYGVLNDEFSLTGVYDYITPTATIHGVINAPFTWTGSQQVSISSSLDVRSDLPGWQPASAGSTMTTSGSYSMTVAAGYLRIIASHAIDGYTWAPYNYEFINVAPGSSHQIDFTIIPRTSSGSGTCPYLYTWNGTDYQIDNNILGNSEISDDIDSLLVDYYPLVVEPKIVNGMYSMAIAEFETEYSIFDSFNLLVVDHPPNTDIAVDQFGNVRTYKNLLSPLYCYDNNGFNQIGNLTSIDSPYFDGYRYDWVEMDFGQLDASVFKLILKSDLKPGSNDPPSPAANDDDNGPINIIIQDKWGQYIEVASINPRNYWSFDIIDLTEYAHLMDNITIRLYWEGHHHLDFVALDTSADEYTIQTEPNLIQSEHFRYGDVTERLLSQDGLLVDLDLFDYITLNFTTVPELIESDFIRDYVLISSGYYCTDEGRPDATMTVSPDNIYSGVEALFDASESTGQGISGYYFDFGDGTNSGWIESPTCSYVYSNPGQYEVTLLIKTNDAPPKISYYNCTVTVSNSPPVANIKIYQDVELTLQIQGRKGNTVTLQILEDGELVKSTAVTRTPGRENTAVINLEKQYGKDYQLVLIYSATHKGANPTWLHISSGENIIEYFKNFRTSEGYSQYDIVDDNYLSEVVDGISIFTFDASNSFDIDGYIRIVKWYFGDGTISFQATVDHEFELTGEFDVSLTVVDNLGASDKKTQTIGVS